MQVTVSELIARYLERLGIEVIFGMPGAHVLPIYDALHRSRVRSVLVKHEQGAAFMAGGLARHGHRAAACVATAGPGATNLITGIANAYAEQLPVLAITGETPTYLFGRGGLQESAGEGGAIDQMGLFSGITRYAKLVERTDYLGQVLFQATQALQADCPGPVLISIPFNVQKESVDAALLDRLPPPAPGNAASSAPPGLEMAVELLAAAQRPVIVAGYGVIRAGARQAVSRLSQEFAIPVASSLKAKGVVAEDGELALGCLGVTSNGDARRYLQREADLVVFLGTSFNERTSYLWDADLLAGKRLIQVDRNADQLGRVFRPNVAIQGDLRTVLEHLLERLHARAVVPKGLTVYERHRAASIGEPSAMSGEGDVATSRFALMAHFYAALAARFPSGAVVFDDNIVFAQSYYAVSERNHYYPNSGISSLGHALPAAIGARFSGADGPVFAVLGDGGFQLCAMELMTAVNYAVPLNVVVINNGTMGPIRKNQFQQYGGRYIDCDFINPDFAALAKAFGVRHYRLEHTDDVDGLFHDADLVTRINLIELTLDKNAFPTYLSTR